MLGYVKGILEAEYNGGEEEEGEGGGERGREGIQKIRLIGKKNSCR